MQMLLLLDHLSKEMSVTSFLCNVSGDVDQFIKHMLIRVQSKVGFPITSDSGQVLIISQLIYRTYQQVPPSRLSNHVVNQYGFSRIQDYRDSTLRLAVS